MYIVATGKQWIGYGVRTTESAVKEIIDSAEHRVLMSIYIITESEILERIERALERGVNVTILLHQLSGNNSIDSTLQKLDSEYQNFQPVSISDEMLHAKVLMSDTEVALVGSANITRGGLKNNYELGVVIEDAEKVHKLEKIILRLIE